MELNIRTSPKTAIEPQLSGHAGHAGGGQRRHADSTPATKPVHVGRDRQWLRKGSGSKVVFRRELMEEAAAVARDVRARASGVILAGRGAVEGSWEQGGAEVGDNSRGKAQNGPGGRLAGSAGSTRFTDSQASRASPDASDGQSRHGLFSSFQLHPKLLSNLQAKYPRITTPTDIQRNSIPPLLEGRNVVLRAETGSGKTLAYLLPILSRLLSELGIPADGRTRGFDRSLGTKVLIISPTRELSAQTEETASRLLSGTPLVVGDVSGGTSRDKEKASLRKGVTVLCATPGRLADHFDSTKAFVYSEISYVVFDEADMLVHLGFEKQMCSCMERLQKASPGVRVCLGSATADERVVRFARRYVQDAKVIGGLFAGSSGAARPLGEAGGGVLGRPERAPAPQGAAEGDGSRATSAPLAASVVPASLKQSFVIVPTKMKLAALLASLAYETARDPNVRILVFAESREVCNFLADICALLGGGGRVTGEVQTVQEVVGARAARGGRNAQAKGNARNGERGGGSAGGSAKARYQSAGAASATDTADTAALDGSESSEGVLSGSGGDKGIQRRQADADAPALQEGDKFILSPVHHIHGGLSQEDRAIIWSRFLREGGVLLSTDVCARGLNLGGDFRSGVDLVIQYEAPSSSEQYVHRAGRSGRAGQNGRSMLFLSEREAGMVELLAAKGCELTPIPVDTLGLGVLGYERPIRLMEKIQGRVEELVSGDQDLKRLATRAYTSYVKGYAVKSADIRHIFSLKALHLGHVAKAFGLTEAPSAFMSSFKAEIKAKRKADRERRPGERMVHKKNRDTKYRRGERDDRKVFG